MSQLAVAADKRPGIEDGRNVSKGRSRPARGLRWRAYRLHRWAGLAAALWILVLGATGFILDHRDWRWLWQETVPESFIPQDIAKKSHGAGARLYRINPRVEGYRVAGGPQGLWWTDNHGGSWNETRFEGLERPPQVFAIVEKSRGDGEILWLATDEGVWFSADWGKTAASFALRGHDVTALAEAGKDNEIIGAVSRSRVFVLDTEKEDANVEWLALGRMSKEHLPGEIDLSRFIHDLHYGRGLFGGASSLLINDAGGIAMVVLPVTGFLFWFLPMRWRKNRKTGAQANHQSQRKTMRLLLSLHGTMLGLISVIPVIYLSVTGIVLDHRDGLLGWMRSAKIDRSLLPPVYELETWDREIYSITGYHNDPAKISIGTRSGLYTTRNNGVTWEREPLPGAPGFVWSMRRIGEDIFIGGMGSPNYVKKGPAPWRIVKEAGHMPSDFTKAPGGRTAWKSHKGVMVENADGGFDMEEIRLPRLEGVPWFYVIDGLHSGLLIHTQWKWINDIVSVLAILVTVTGLMRWWRRKKVAIHHSTRG